MRAGHGQPLCVPNEPAKQQASQVVQPAGTRWLSLLPCPQSISNRGQSLDVRVGDGGGDGALGGHEGDALVRAHATCSQASSALGT